MCQRYDKGRLHRALLKAGADPLATCDKGRTAIDYARLAMKRKKVYAQPGAIERLIEAMVRAAS